MSLSVDGVWKAGVWATTVWTAGVWFEGSSTVDYSGVSKALYPGISLPQRLGHDVSYHDVV